jgi:hypothetical protein
VEGNRTEFSIVAPKGENELYVSQSELEILGPIRDKEIKDNG